MWLFYWLGFFAECYGVILLFILFIILYTLCKFLCTKKLFFPIFLITCCVFINVYIIFYLNDTSALIGVACFV